MEDLKLHEFVEVMFRYNPSELEDFEKQARQLIENARHRPVMGVGTGKELRNERETGCDASKSIGDIG